MPSAIEEVILAIVSEIAEANLSVAIVSIGIAIANDRAAREASEAASASSSPSSCAALAALG